jgi:hypothetical protein
VCVLVCDERIGRGLSALFISWVRVRVRVIVGLRVMVRIRVRVKFRGWLTDRGQSENKIQRFALFAV